MAENSESDNRLLLSFITSSRSVLIIKNRDSKSFGHAIVFACHPSYWTFNRGQPAKVFRFNQYELNSI